MSRKFEKRKNKENGLEICYNVISSDLITQSCQVPLKAFMFTLQSLDTGQVMTVVVCVEGLVLLLDPLFSFISIPEKFCF